MDIKVYKTEQIDSITGLAVLVSKELVFEAPYLTETEYEYVKKRITKGDTFIAINQYHRHVFIVVLDQSKPPYIKLEDARKAGFKAQSVMNEQLYEKLFATHSENDAEALLAFTEGLLLGSYRFNRHFKNKDDKQASLKEVGLICEPLTQHQINELCHVAKALYTVRNLVNEPVSHLNAEQLSVEIETLCKVHGCKTEIFNKSKIEALKMGGLIAVNKGSVDPPTFTVVSWEPENAINAKPYILVGKGVVYDTGGLSLKPTGDSMDYMKSDMSGAAIVAGTISAIAANKLPIHVIALIPATDNRPGGNAYAPGDVVTIMDGTTIEMLNSDAEGRMILADALVYAKRYDPELVIDVATLTGSASIAIGPYALVAMGTAPDNVKKSLVACGENVYEKIVEFPLWDEYGELIKSDIADLKNVGGKNAGAITAGKFLQHFTSYPWMHFDIAGVAFSKKTDSYRGKGGTGYSMRLLYQFFKAMAK